MAQKPLLKPEYIHARRNPKEKIPGGGKEQPLCQSCGSGCGRQNEDPFSSGEPYLHNPAGVRVYGLVSDVDPTVFDADCQRFRSGSILPGWPEGQQYDAEP
jgi:hypothetical protein